MDNRRFNNNRNEYESNRNSRDERNRFLNPDENYRTADADYSYRAADMNSNRDSISRSADADYNRDAGYGSSELNYDRDLYRRDWRTSFEPKRSSSYGPQNRSWPAGERNSFQNDRSFDQGRFDYDHNRWQDFSDRDRGQEYSRWNDRSSYTGHQESAGRHEGFMDSAKDAVKSFFGKGPKGYQRSDERIKEDVSEALYRHHHIDASDIEVSVKSGTVTLSGTVPDRSTKRLAEDVAEQCTGVNNVSNLLMVDSNFGSQNLSASNQQSSGASSRAKSIQ